MFPLMSRTPRTDTMTVRTKVMASTGCRCDKSIATPPCSEQHTRAPRGWPAPSADGQLRVGVEQVHLLHVKDDLVRLAVLGLGGRIQPGDEGVLAHREVGVHLGAHRLRH